MQTQATETDAVLITGTSTGIGYATALHLDRLGFSVFATVRKEEDADRLRAVCTSRLTPIILDVTSEPGIASAVEEVSERLGSRRLAGLINNAGIGFAAPLECAPLPEVRRLFDVNVFGVLAVTQAFLPQLRQARGRVVNISSTASLFVAPFHGPYSASKLALNGLNHALRRELGPLGVDVVLVIAGSVNTPIWTKPSERGAELYQRFASEAAAVYDLRYRRLLEFFSRMGSRGLASETAARQICQAITDQRPRNTYFVGPDAQLFRFASPILYGRVRDWVLSRLIGVG